MIYEIINPSDPYTIEGEFKTCCVATVILGEGAYGLDGTESMPIFLISDADEWFRQAFSATLEDVLQSTPPAELAACLDSVLCCSAKERRALAGEERLAFHDARRSSQNDIGRRAWALAERVRGKGESDA